MIVFDSQLIAYSFVIIDKTAVLWVNQSNSKSSIEFCKLIIIYLINVIIYTMYIEGINMQLKVLICR